jgi:hypothetical protein
MQAVRSRAAVGGCADHWPVDHLVLAASPGAVGRRPFASLDSGALRQAFGGKFLAHFNALRAARSGGW